MLSLGKSTKRIRVTYNTSELNKLSKRKKVTADNGQSGCMQAWKEAARAFLTRSAWAKLPLTGGSPDSQSRQPNRNEGEKVQPTCPFQSHLPTISPRGCWVLQKTVASNSWLRVTSRPARLGRLGHHFRVSYDSANALVGPVLGFHFRVAGDNAHAGNRQTLAL